MTTRISVSADNLPYLQSLAQTWGCDQTKAINYLLFQLRVQATAQIASTTPTAPTAQFVKVPVEEMYREVVPGKFVPFEEIAPQAEEVSDPVIEKFLAIGLDSF